MMKKIISLLCLFAFLPAVAYAAGDETGGGEITPPDVTDTENPGGDSGNTGGGTTEGGSTGDGTTEGGSTGDGTTEGDTTDPVTPPAVTPENLITANTTYETKTDAGLEFKEIIVDDYEKHAADNTPLPGGNGNLYVDITGGGLIRTVEDIKTTGQLYVNTDRSLTITRFPDNTSGPAYNLTFGSVDLLGAFTATGVGTLTVNDATNVSGTMTATAQTIQMGETKINTGGNINIGADTISLAMATIANGGTLTVGNSTNTGTFTVGDPTTDILGTTNVFGKMDVTAGTIKMGETTVTGTEPVVVALADDTVVPGTLNLTATGSDGSIDIGKLNTIRNTVTSLTAAKIQTGNIENPTGTMTINVGDSMTVNGVVTNGGKMTFTGGGALIVDGTITNSGNMVLGRDEMPGGAGTPDLASLTADEIILSGDSSFSAVISGATTITNGFNLTGMGTGGRFNLETGTLDAGFSETTNLNNKLSSFTLAVANGELALGDIINGGLDKDNPDNSDAVMRLAAEKITVDSITNNGSALNITDYKPANSGKTYLVNDITVTGDIYNNSGEMNLDANNAFTAGNVHNTGGNMILNGQQSLKIDGISISGGTALIASSSDTSGLAKPNGGITIGNGGISNSGGALKVVAKELNVNGNITHDSTAGTTFIRVNDTMGVTGNINIAGGKLTVDALGTGTGIVNVGGTFVVGETGQIDLDSSVNSVVVGGSITVAGNLLGGTSTADGNGNLNVYNNTSQGFSLTSTDGNIEIVKDIRLTTNVSSGARSITLAAANMVVGGDVYVGGANAILTLGSDIYNPTDPTNVLVPALGQTLNVTNTAGVANGAKMVIKAGTASVGALKDTETETVDGNTVIVGSAGSIDAYGNRITTTGPDGIILAGTGGIRFDGNANTTGLNILTSGSQFALSTSNKVADIDVTGGMLVADGKTLNVTSGRNLTIGGAIEMLGTFIANVDHNASFDNKITNTGSFNVTTTTEETGYGNITTNDITNSSTMNLTASGNIDTGAITNSGGISTFAADKGKITSSLVDVTGGNVIIRAKKSVDVNSDVNVLNGQLNIFTIDIENTDITLGSITLNGTDSAKKSLISISSGNLGVAGKVSVSGNSNLALDVPDVVIDGAITVTDGNMSQGNWHPIDEKSFLWLDTSTRPNVNLTAESLNVDGYFKVTLGTGIYNFASDATIGGELTVASASSADITADTITIGGFVANDGTLSLTATGVLIDTNIAIQTGNIENSGTLTLNTGAGIANVGDFTNSSTGIATLSGAGMTSNNEFVTPGIVYQGANVSPAAGGVAILSDNYTIRTSDIFAARGITQADGNHLTIYAGNSINIQGNVTGSDITFVSTNSNVDAQDWRKAFINIAGNVSGGTSFLGMQALHVGKNYTFNDNSRIGAMIKSDANSNYWATITMDPGDDFGKITNNKSTGALALINVDGQFISRQEIHGDTGQGGNLPNAGIGIELRDMVDQGTAIWLLYAMGNGAPADESPLQELGDKLRNLNVMFCNADGTNCFSYFKGYDKDMPNLPAYLSVRDTDGDGKNDSLYVVFDPRFGGPIEVFQIQPIVDETKSHTDNEYVSAGALDDWIIGKLHESGFYNRTPIEAIPVIFAGTNMERLANELYARMERYMVDRDGTGLARFSRLVTPREVENLMGSISLNEHTNFRGFEDHMLNEFIWNRNRRLKNAWVDVDFGIFNQDVSDGTTVDGNRFSISGGFDWQHDRTTIFGLTARVSHMSMDNNDSFDLGYIPGQPIDGHVDVTVDDTNIGVGGYMIKTLNPKMRLYGNLFADIHMLSVSRDMNYMSKIDGDGNAFAITTEWGLMHDWLNQYVVGNLYVRAGYNTGFSITERADGADYMKLESDGYVNVAPGYTLTMQKRIYPSAWVQIRPYISAGVEYDVLGMPDTAKYKFASAQRFTDYDIEINPLWANFGGGVDVLSVRGFQVGLDYRYQYNTDIRMHNIRVSGSYRF